MFLSISKKIGDLTFEITLVQGTQEVNFQLNDREFCYQFCVWLQPRVMGFWEWIFYLKRVSI